MGKKFKPTKHRWPQRGATVSIDCRMCGPGGTTITMRATPQGVRCVWEHENMPYRFDGVTIDETTREASDGHNVSVIPWADFVALAALAPKRA